jgi:uncharacterized protein (TIGR00251 family)
VIVATASGVIIDVRVIPRASKAGVGGTRDGALLVRLNAPPVEGAANDELVDVIAKSLGVPRRSVTIVSGERARMKKVRVDGLSAADAARALGLADHEGPRRT